MSREECDYCGAAFDDEQNYLRHLQAKHGDELGPIEQRRVADLASDEGHDVVVYAGVLGVVALFGLLAYVMLFSGGGTTGTSPDGGADAGAAQTPHAVGSVHYHGTMNVTVGGQELDFSREEFQYQADPFHFERGNGVRWHVHAKGVTLGYAMQTLGIDVSNETVTFRGTTYGDDPDETARVLVNGEPVDPATYVLQKGDRVRVVANESA